MGLCMTFIFFFVLEMEKYSVMCIALLFLYAITFIYMLAIMDIICWILCLFIKTDAFKKIKTLQKSIKKKLRSP